jgi:putative flippase GtrA
VLTKAWDKFRIVRFAAVGIVNTIVDFAVLNILVFGVSLNKLPANMISVSVAITVSYILNHAVVFRQVGEGNDHKRRVALFVAITLVGAFVIQNLVIYLFVHVVTLPANILQSITDALGLNFSIAFVTLNTAKLAATVCTMVWNYLLYRKYVFTKT